MATPKLTPPPTAQADALVKATADLGSSLVSLSTAMLALPLSFLPPQARHDATSAARDAVEAVGKLNLSVVKALSTMLDAWAQAIDKAVAETTKPAR